jgi:hypothetical protein
MKFPITRESLQSYDYDRENLKKKEEWVQKQLTVMLADICNDFEKDIQNNIHAKKFVWRDLQHKLSMIQCQTVNDFLPRFIEKLKTTFVECDIIVDALKTHIIIDWC